VEKSVSRCFGAASYAPVGVAWCRRGPVQPDYHL